MWILPKNYPLSSAFAQDMVASKEDLTCPGLNIESSLMSRSKPMRLQTWLRKWKQGNYHHALFTRILKHSHRTCFEEKLTLSLADTHANHSHYQETEREKMTSDTSGSTSGDIHKQLNLPNVSLKTCEDIYRLDLTQSSAIWKKMVTEQHGEYSQRVKLVRHTKEKEFLSFPTPTASDWKNMDTSNQMMLSKVVKWATPTAHMAKEGGYPAEYERNTPTLTAQATASENKPHSSGYLNPDWVEWLMGVPTGWTDLGSWGTE